MTEIIAEVGVNHGGKLHVAKQYVDQAILAGADVVKFQTYQPHLAIHPQHADFDLLESLALSPRDFTELKKHCDGRGIEFMSTPGDLASLRFLVNELGVKRLKIGSDDLFYPMLLRAAGATKLPIILSTGMAFEADIAKALSYLNTKDVTLLHCVSCYPCPLVDANISAMVTMRKFGHPVGYSDHTSGILACVIAASLGATVIEKHIKLWTPAIDESVSASIAEFGDMVKSVRAVKIMLGHGAKVPCEEEIKNKPLFIKDTCGFKRGVV